MKYYKVKPEYDNIPVYKMSKGKVVNNGDILIGNELLTEKEFQKYKNNYVLPRRLKWDDVVEERGVFPEDTYYMFGARFEANPDFSDTHMDNYI